MSPEERIEEGEALIEAVKNSKQCSWARFKALNKYAAWTREHAPAIIRFARKAQREKCQCTTNS